MSKQFNIKGSVLLLPNQLRKHCRFKEPLRARGEGRYIQYFWKGERSLYGGTWHLWGT